MRYLYQDRKLADDVLKIVIECYGVLKSVSQCRDIIQKKLNRKIATQQIHYYYTCPSYKQERDYARKIYLEQADNIIINNAICRLEELQKQYELVQKAFKNHELELKEYMQSTKMLFEQARDEQGLKQGIGKSHIVVEGDMNINQQYNVITSLPDRYLERIAKKEITIEEAQKLLEEENANATT